MSLLAVLIITLLGLGFFPIEPFLKAIIAGVIVAVAWVLFLVPLAHGG